MTTAAPPTEASASTPAAEELRAWLRLAHARGLRPLALRLLLAAFGGPCEVLTKSFASLAQVAGPGAAEAVLGPPAEIEGTPFGRYIEGALAWAAEPGNRILTLADSDYPQALLNMPDPPALLYAKGRLERLQARAVAIVGSRHATPQGLEDARRFAHALSGAGLAVISGLALGIDAAAHRGALGSAAGTVAVIGTGADLVYPAAHRGLAHEIARDGAILSEWPLGTPARSANFPQRNRLIAGLSGGVLIVEAAMRSGSLITARLANEMGRDVFALPGSIHAPLAQGCHRLIKQGAKLVETPEEILEEFGFPTPATAAASRSTAPQPVSASWASARLPSESQPGEQTARVLAALGHAPATLEILAARTQFDGAALQGMLLQLEMSGHVAPLPGGRYMAVGRP
ncbi:DNA-processing protein DprA [Caballeronia sp. LZ043]|uniref:DNA-processing protein DprA n=1 Tax=Caballeronia sp. LZ043 TaxID=3038569 RepID=UPI00285E3DBD|nr:DNA-processing protein DprA [Caballeronia sp. LZ043]MDR5818896.1 DNA-processing protein DprA [Caballeronia sp. LZ043]